MTLDARRMKQAARETFQEKAVEAGRSLLNRVRPTGAATPQSFFTAEPLFRSTIPPSAPNQARTLAIMCNSWQFHRQSEEFLFGALNVDEYDLLAVPGGVQWLALPDILPKHNKVARWMTEYLIDRHQLTRVVCIAHENCSAYEDHTTLGAIAHTITGKSTFEHQIDQLRAAARTIAEFGVAAELYYASTDKGAVVFHKVEATPAPKAV